ncbi:MAG: alpha/beta hydrolase [Proteobacteria bacterium]|nr:alpha/beta hydrolase [Pseudomonadota bacterium]MBU4583475.1 alpha/beta hydrolase [Pseudomonadota bacterium]MCG2740142.1 alpha/beta hydrolase [Syntrophaceae bacterium]
MKKILAISLCLFVVVLVAIYFLLPETLFNLAVKAGRHSAGLTKKEIQVDDHKIVYLEGGKGQTILLLHGFAANKDNWIRFTKYLTGDYHVVIPDIPGFGESSQIQNQKYAAENQLKRIERFTEVLKLEKFHVVGNSMGGMLAAMYGAKYPQKVLTLALLAPGGVGSPNPSEVAILLQKGTNPLLTGNTEDFDRLIRLCFVKPPFIPAQFKKVLAADAIAHRDFNKKIWDDMMGNLTKEALSLKENLLKPYLPEIQAPVLIIWGDGDKILNVGGVSVLEKNLKDYKTVIMKETGHTPMLEKPKETASYYVSYLKGKK